MFQAVRAFVKISGELPMMVLPNPAQILEKTVPRGQQNESGGVSPRKKEKEKRRIATIVLDVSFYEL